MNLLEIYGRDLPSFLEDAANTPPMLRLKRVGMNCGCEYTSFPRFVGIGAYHRWEHSLGVAGIVWHFTGSPAQALAGLLHDVATPTFAHVIDFLRGDHLTQEATEDGTAQIIDGCAPLQQILHRCGLTTEDVCDYHRYPIADNDSPRLSADRLEYTLGNLVNFGFCDRTTVKGYYDDLRVGTGDDGAPELVFRTPEVARAFALSAMRCGEIYVSDVDRYAMQALADLLGGAVKAGVLAEEDFMSTEPELLDRLCRHPEWAERWRAFCALHEIERSGERPTGEGWLKIPAKKRCIDPMVDGHRRASSLFPDFREILTEFLNASQDYWVRGK